MELVRRRAEAVAVAAAVLGVLLGGCGTGEDEPSATALDQERVDTVVAGLRELTEDTADAARETFGVAVDPGALGLTPCEDEGEGVGRIEGAVRLEYLDANADETEQVVADAWEGTDVEVDVGTDGSVGLRRDVEGAQVSLLLRPPVQAGDGSTYRVVDVTTGCLDLGPELYAEVRSELNDSAPLGG